MPPSSPGRAGRAGIRGADRDGTPLYDPSPPSRYSEDGPVPSSEYREGAVLSVEDIGLVLDLPREQVTFTPEGLGRIRAEGRSVLIELRAKSGATPRVHRIDDVDEATATAFADGVNATLANRTDSDDVDGAPFTVVRSLVPTWRTRFRILRGALWHLLALVVLCVVAGSLGRWDLVLLTVPIGGLPGWAYTG